MAPSTPHDSLYTVTPGASSCVQARRGARIRAQGSVKASVPVSRARVRLPVHVHVHVHVHSPLYLPVLLHRIFTKLAGRQAQKVGRGGVLWFLLQAEVASIMGE